jgi:hypothetical protein
MLTLFPPVQCARSGWLSAREIKQAIDAELRERAGVFFARFFRYRQIILHLGVPYLLKYLDQKPDFNLHAEVLYQLLEPKPDSIESLLTRLSSRVTHACPAGVLATAQRVSAAAQQQQQQQQQQPTTIVIGSPPAPPAAPVKATPTPTPALRPTAAITTSPLLLAAYNTPMMNPSAQVYCTLPPPREGPLLASPHTSYAPPLLHRRVWWRVSCGSGRGTHARNCNNAQCAALGRVVQRHSIGQAAAARQLRDGRVAQGPGGSAGRHQH